MKYIDADKLIANLERQNVDKKIIQPLICIIDSLQQEQPDCHTVEDWIQHIKNSDLLTKDIFSKGPYDVLYNALNHPYQYCYDAIKEFGELCFQTGVNSVKQEQPYLPDNLDEAANKFAVSYDQGTCDGIAQECFKAGAQWMKEQMMNDVVEGTLAGQLLSSLTENGKQMVITVPRNTFPSNPKTKNIKLIIVKEN